MIRTLQWYRDVPGLDFADAYVAALAVARGHGVAVSFDRHLGRVPGITRIHEPGHFGTSDDTTRGRRSKVGGGPVLMPLE